MVTGSKSAKYAKVIKQIKAVLFLGVPHRGSELANISQYWYFGNSDIRGVLRPDSPVLEKLFAEFYNLPSIQNDIKLYYFYEQRPTSYRVHSMIVGINLK